MNPSPFLPKGLLDPDLVARFERMPPAEREVALKATLRMLHAENQQYKALVEEKKRLLAQAAILAVRDGSVLMATRDNGVLSTKVPKHLSPAPVPGDLVWCNPEDGNIYEIETDIPAIGPKMKVVRRIGAHAVEVRGDDLADRIVIDKTGAKEGDEVTLDGSAMVVAKNLGPAEHVSELAFQDTTGVSWDDIAGQEEAKKALREAIEGPVLHPNVYKAFGKDPCKGILLYGPPGNGKTLFAKAIADEADALFLYVKGPEVLQGIIGQSEGKVRKIFAAARDHHKKSGRAAIVCIDEADAILGRRTDSRISMEKTIVPQFLAEMDGIDPSGALCILLTNRPDTLDPAVTREGRIDLKIGIPRPQKDDAIAILTYHLGKRLVAPGLEVGALAKATADSLFSPRHVLYMVRMHRGMDTRVGLERFVSGAMCAGVVDRATQKAIRRHLSGETPMGVTAEDLDTAVKETPAQIKALSHDTILSELVEEFGRGNVKSIDPA